MDIKEIQSLIRFVAKSGATEVKLEMEDFKITIRTGSMAYGDGPYVHPVPMAGAPMVSMPVPGAMESTGSATAGDMDGSKEKAPEASDKYITINSPIIGTFYRKPSPDKPPFVEVGSVINKGDVLCVIEAMKLFNDIESEVSGKVVKILVDDSSPVEFDQPLFLVDPS